MRLIYSSVFAVSLLGIAAAACSDEPEPQYPQQGYPQQGYPQQGYPQQGYPTQQYPTQQYPTQQYPQQTATATAQPTTPFGLPIPSGLIPSGFTLPSGLPGFPTAAPPAQ